MTALKDKRPAAIRVVIPFVFRHWLQQPGRAAIVAGGLLGRDRGRPVHADLFRPAGRCADAGRVRSGGAACRVHGLWRHRGAGPDVDDPAADRPAGDRAVHAEDRCPTCRATPSCGVQRFSTDWHANCFAGSTVRKVTRGMWALDLLNDTLLMALAPSLLVLLGSMILLGLHWPCSGAVIAVGTVIYVSMTLAFSMRLHRAGRARLQRLGHQGWRHAGRRLDLQRGGEILRRGSARGRAAGGVIGRWRTRVRRTWYATTTLARRSSRCCCASAHR